MAHQSTVLLVEDDGDLRVALAGLLAQAGYQVRTAWDGVSAMLEMELALPDLIVCDLHMPRMSGFELLAEIRLHFPKIRLIAMSETLGSDLFPTGAIADGFYQKGTHPVLLLRLLSSMTRWSTSYPRVD
jgi:CheY-like chemotaxis protein